MPTIIVTEDVEEFVTNLQKPTIAKLIRSIGKVHLVHAAIKKSQKTPPKEVETALSRIKTLDEI